MTSDSAPPPARRPPLRIALWLLGVPLAALLGLLLGIALLLAVAYPKLPETDGLGDYRPRLPLRMTAVGDDVPVAEHDRSRRVLGDVGLVRDEHDRDALAVQLLQ